MRMLMGLRITLLAWMPLMASATAAFIVQSPTVTVTTPISTASTSQTKRYSTSEEIYRDIPVPASELSSTPQDRAIRAKETWSTVALQPTVNKKETIELNNSSSNVIVIHNQRLFDEFSSMKGTYFTNGLSSCQLGDRLVHPFEAHGYCHSLVFDGQGHIHCTSRIVDTPLNQKEREKDQILHRGVMSTVADVDSFLGNVRNALSSSERDTANLTADLWPLPNNNNKDGIDPILIVCTDNGEPYALDPQTLQMKGRLGDVLPKLNTIFPEGTKCLAHTRYDSVRNTFVMCVFKMIIPGEEMKGNSYMEFLEFDDNFDLVSRRDHTTRFIVFHDWALTQNYYVIPKNPAYLQWANIGKFTLGQSIGTDVFAMEEETNGEFILIPRHDVNEEVKEVKSDAFFNCFHIAPTFEKEEENELIINGCVFDYYTFGGEMGFDGSAQTFDPVKWGSVGGMAPPPRLDQFVIDTKTFEMKSKERVPVIPVDMPTFNGDAKPCKYSYFLGAKRPEGWFPFRQIVKLDLETFDSVVYDVGDGRIASEPMFLPRPDPKSEDDGFVVSIVHNSDEKTAEMLIWDAETFGDGPIAECTLGDLIPWCVHGSFYPGYIP